MGVHVRLWLTAFLLLTCAAGSVQAAGRQQENGQIWLVETHPIETPLDNPDLPDAHLVWLEMIRGAQHSLAFAEFYASNQPGSRLEEVIGAIEEAASRGVSVRFLGEEKFYRTYPQTLDRLNARTNIEVRRLQTGDHLGGVLHAKYFIVDDRELFIGSQNFDWRALTHIQELGVRIRHADVVRAVQALFDLDWAIAGGSGETPKISAIFPAVMNYEGEPVEVTPVMSPGEWLPDGGRWDLPELIGLIDGAEQAVRIQLLSYRTVGRDGTYFDQLESALRRAAARGAQVQLLLADWSKRPGTIEGLQSLQAIPNLEVKLVTIPPWSGGFIPYARVIHAKYMVIDGERAWLGTSNWEHDYFYASRNVGVLIEGASLAGRLDSFFKAGWSGPYAEMVDPCAEYEVPRIGD